MVERSRVFVDTPSHQKEDVPDIISIYAMDTQMRLTASDEVVQAAERFMLRTTDAYDQPIVTFAEIEAKAIEGSLDSQQELSKTGRTDLVGGTGRSDFSIFSRGS